MVELIHADLTYLIRGRLFDVHNRLGPGLPESFYEEAAHIGFQHDNVPCTRQEEWVVLYRELKAGRFFTDLFVDRKVVLELKATPELTPLDRAQILSYLKATGADLGLLANFGAGGVQVERFPNFLASSAEPFHWEPKQLADEGLLYPELVGQLYEGLYSVHWELGPGFRHPVYRRASGIECRFMGLGVEYLRDYDVYYHDHYLGKRPCRLLRVENKILVAAVAFKEITGAERTRLKVHMRRLGLKLGLIANFHDVRLHIEPVRIS